MILSRIYTLYSKRKFISGQDSYNNGNDIVYQSNLRDEVLMSLRKIKNNVETAESPKVDMWCHLGTSFIRAPGEGSVHFSLSLMNICPSIKSPSCLKAVFFSYVVSSLSSFSLFLHRVLGDALSFYVSLMRFAFPY